MLYLYTIFITTFLWVSISMMYVCHVDGTVRIWSDTSLMNTYILYMATMNPLSWGHTEYFSYNELY